MTLACDQKADKTSQNGNEGNLNNLENAPLVEKFIIGNEEFEVGADDEKMVEEAARAQGFMQELSEDKGEFGLPQDGIAQQFYKCGKNIAHSFLDKRQVEDSQEGSALANSLKENLTVIFDDVLIEKVGDFESYMVALDAGSIPYLFLTTESKKQVYYTWQDQSTKKWFRLRPLLDSGVRGLVTARFDTNLQKIVVKVFNYKLSEEDLDGDGMLYSFVQNGTSFQASGAAKNSSQGAFDQMQKAQGNYLSSYKGISLNSLRKVEEVEAPLSAVVIENLMTMGGAFVAKNFYEEEQSALTEFVESLKKKVCF